MLRALALCQETAVNSIPPERVGSIMYDTLAYINQMQLQGANPLLISKIYASVEAMEADSAPVSDLTGQPLRAGQVVCIADPTDPDDPDTGLIYRYDGTEGDVSSWTAVGRIGSDPYLEGYQYMGVAKLTPAATDPGTPTQKVFYLASEPGTYTNFDNLVVADGEVAVLKYNGSWSKDTPGIASAAYVDSVDAVKKTGAAPLAENTDLNNLGYGVYSFTSAVSQTLVHCPQTGGGYLVVERTTPANTSFQKQTIVFGSSRKTYIRYGSVGGDFTIWAEIIDKISALEAKDTQLQNELNTINLKSKIFCYFAGGEKLYTEGYGLDLYFKPTSESVAFNVYKTAGGDTIYTAANWAAVISALQATAETSPSGVTNCLKLTQHQYLVFKTDTNSLAIISQGSTLSDSDIVLLHNVRGRALEVNPGLYNAKDAEAALVAYKTTNNASVAQLQSDVQGLEDAVGEMGLSIPDYWSTYMASKIGVINENCRAIGKDGDNFVFITDIHNEDNGGYSPSLIRMILQKTPVRNIIIGGDLLSSATSREDACEKIQALRNKYDYTERVFPVRGNHDVNVDSDTAITDGDYYAIMERPLENILNTEKKLYYFRDNDAQKIRYIFIDAYGGTDSALDADQVEWIKTKARELQSGWNVVFVAHPYWHVSTGATNTVLAIGTYLKNLINELIDGVSGDNPISPMAAKVIALIVGHVHRDKIELVSATEQNYWIVGTTCDKGGTNNFDPDHSVRTLGTIHEHAFDVFNLKTNNRNIYTTRIGEGGDRIIHGSVFGVDLGDTRTITSAMSGTLTWSSNDSSIVTITSGVAAGVSQGTTFVWAEDENENKEYWIINVR